MRTRNIAYFVSRENPAGVYPLRQVFVRIGSRWVHLWWGLRARWTWIGGWLPTWHVGIRIHRQRDLQADCF